MMPREMLKRAWAICLALGVIGVLQACGGGGSTGGESGGSGGSGGGGSVAPILSLLAGSDGGLGNVDGTGQAARFAYPGGAAVDSLGNIYVADTNNHTIRKITPAGVVTTLAGAAGTAGSADGTGAAARFAGPSGVAVDGVGNVYVADEGNYTIRKITPVGVVTTLAGAAGMWGSTDGMGAAARFVHPRGIAVDSVGDVYVADAVNNTIRKITPAGAVATLAGTAGTAGSADGTGAAARFNLPDELAVDGTGNVYVADSNNHTIRKITPAGVVTTLAGTAGMVGSDDGVGAAARFTSPTGVAVDSAGNVYVVDSGNHTIRKIDATGVVTTLAGTAGAGGSMDGTGAAARFFYPQGVAVDSAGKIYVADRDNHSIRKIDIAGAVTTLAGAAITIGSADGSGAAARFDNPRDIATDAAGNVYVADQSNHTIRKIDMAGVVTTLAGTAGASGSTDGTGAAARFSSPSSVAADNTGNVYVADNNNHTIRKIDSAGVVTTLAGTAGMWGSADGTGAAARFSYPQGIAVDNAGNVYVADTANRTIRKITSAGVVTTLAGTAGMVGSTDGTGAAARFSSPSSIAVDSAGNVYVVEVLNHTVRKISLTGVVTTLAGMAGVAGSTDGTGAAARFDRPDGVTVDSVGNVYVADNNNNTIRKIDAAGGVTTLVGQVGLIGLTPGNLPGALSYPHGLAILGNTLYAVTNNAIVKVSNLP